MIHAVTASLVMAAGLAIALLLVAVLRGETALAWVALVIGLIAFAIVLWIGAGKVAKALAEVDRETEEIEAELRVIKAGGMSQVVVSRRLPVQK